jgi:hypothetical protein
MRRAWYRTVRAFTNEPFYTERDFATPKQPGPNERSEFGFALIFKRRLKFCFVLDFQKIKDVNFLYFARKKRFQNVLSGFVV